MEKKGLCGSCVNDKDCTFLRMFPVLQCEEFIGDEQEAAKSEKTKRKINLHEEPVAWE